MRVGGQRIALAALPPGNIRGTHYTGYWLDLAAGLVGCENLAPSGVQIPNRTGRIDYAIPTHMLMDSYLSIWIRIKYFTIGRFLYVVNLCTRRHFAWFWVSTGKTRLCRDPVRSLRALWWSVNLFRSVSSLKSYHCACYAGPRFSRNYTLGNSIFRITTTIFLNYKIKAFSRKCLLHVTK